MVAGRDAEDVSSIATDVLDPDQDVRLGSSPGIGEPKDVLEEFGLVVVGRLNEAVLLLLEVERRALLLVQEPLEKCVVHGQHLLGSMIQPDRPWR